MEEYKCFETSGFYHIFKPGCPFPAEEWVKRFEQMKNILFRCQIRLDDHDDSDELFEEINKVLGDL